MQLRVWKSIIVSVKLQNGYTAHTVHVKVSANNADINRLRQVDADSI